MASFFENLRGLAQKGQDAIRNEENRLRRDDTAAAMRWDYWRNLSDEQRDAYMGEQNKKHEVEIAENNKWLQNSLDDIERRGKEARDSMANGLNQDDFDKEISQYRTMLEKGEAAFRRGEIDGATWNKTRDKIFENSKNAEERLKQYKDAENKLENLAKERDELFSNHQKRQDDINKSYQDFIDYYGLDLDENVYKKRIESGKSGSQLLEGVDNFLGIFSGDSKGKNGGKSGGKSEDKSEDDSDTVTFTLPRANDPEYGGFAQKIIDLGLATDKGLWGSDGDVAFYTQQLYDQDALDANGNLKIGVPIKLKRRKV